MSITVRFFSLCGPFKTVKEQSFSNRTKALVAVKAYAGSKGYTDIKIEDDLSLDCFRFIGKTSKDHKRVIIAEGEFDCEY